ncbi:alpha/beta hydrolase [Desmospora sp. 8437]|nr:alpha/beta hydrolase [Desmospora sp. 8437]
MSKMDCTIGDLKIHYAEHGSGTPVLLLHGYSLDHRMMTACMEPVFAERPDYHRIYPDLPGMGLTPAQPWIQNSDDMLKAILSFIDTVIPDRPFLVVGESYGGYLAQGIAAKKEEQVMGLALICPMVIPDASRRTLPDPTVLHRDERLLSELESTAAPEAVEDFKQIAVIQDRSHWERFDREILAGSRLADADLLQRVKSNYGFSHDLNRELEKSFTGPTLILAGRQDAAVGYQDQWVLNQRYPRASFAVLDRAGHNLHIEQSRLFEALVTEWLDRVEEVRSD